MQAQSKNSDISPERFILKHMGRTQVGKPVRDVRTAIQRAYDTLAVVDMDSLSKKEKTQLMYTVEAV